MKLDKDIAIFENIISPDQCHAIIDHYERLAGLNLSFSRLDLRDAPSHKKNDRMSFVLDSENLKVTPDMSVMHSFLNAFWICWSQYLDHYSVLAETGKHRIRSMKLQKTLPGQGYHIWHYESDAPERADRIASWGFYLNDVEQGGETEFLYQTVRIPARQGTLVIWPAGYTHVHRGNPPLDGEKYLLTGWVEW
jgi:hypothetical protein